MSSLIASASPWNNDSNDNCTRKRIPTMRKTVKVRPYVKEIISVDETADTLENMANIDDTESIHNDRSNRVNELINQMSNVTQDNDGSSLADFRPPPMPETNLKKDMPDLKIDPESQNQIPIQRPITNPFINTQTLGTNNNYNTAYDTSPTLKPYYSNMGISAPNTASSVYDGRITEKINYMIHLLENQESEKTANVTEEFILYTFLGVFIIYICDSFSRGGKYVR